MQCAAHSLKENMRVVNHIIGVINLLLLLFLIFLPAMLSSVMAVLSTVIGLILVLTPISLGLIIALKYFSSKDLKGQHLNMVYCIAAICNLLILTFSFFT